jgi:hypothetical protein
MFDLFIGRTPSGAVAGPPLYAFYKQYGLTLGLMAPRGGLSHFRASAGVRLGAGRWPL